jgi:hypothetical protein
LTGAVRTDAQDRTAGRTDGFGEAPMPIRFRCPNCQQLMGIARRKAGQMVRCPTCERDVRVPDEEASPVAPVLPRPPYTAPAPAEAGPVFDRGDFDALLHAPSSGQAVAPPAPRPPPQGVPGAGRRPALVPNVEPVSLATGPTTGLVLSSRQVTLGSALAVVVVAIAFAAGVLVGRYLL